MTFLGYRAGHKLSVLFWGFSTLNLASGAHCRCKHYVCAGSSSRCYQFDGDQWSRACCNSICLPLYFLPFNFRFDPMSNRSKDNHPTKPNNDSTTSIAFGISVMCICSGIQDLSVSDTHLPTSAVRATFCGNHTAGFCEDHGLITDF